MEERGLEERQCADRKAEDEESVDAQGRSAHAHTHKYILLLHPLFSLTVRNFKDIFS